MTRSEYEVYGAGTSPLTTPTGPSPFPEPLPMSALESRLLAPVTVPIPAIERAADQIDTLRRMVGELRWATPEHSAARSYLANAAEHLLQATACVRAACRTSPIPTPSPAQEPPL